MSAEPMDMRIPESFHRLKRTLLLFCAAMTVIGLAAQQGVAKITMGWLDDVTLPLVTVSWLLQFGATYYLWGFIMEALVTRRLNTRLMLTASAQSFDDHIKKMGLEFAEQGPRLMALYNFVHHTVGLAAERWSVPNNEHERDLFRSRVTREVAASLREEDRLTERQARVVEQIMVEEAFLPKSPSNELQILISNHLQPAIRRIDEHIDHTHLLIAKLGEASRDVTRIEDGILVQRRISFWAWDVGSAILAFIVSSVILWPHLHWWGLSAVPLFFIGVVLMFDRDHKLSAGKPWFWTELPEIAKRWWFRGSSPRA